MSLVQRALQRAREDAARPTTPAGTAAGPPRAGRERVLAIGDPQAPLETFLRILELHGALGDDGRLHPSVALVSLGDHFDWGAVADRDRAAADGLALLAWLAAHPPEQVTILAGNHDLARVGELHGIDDKTFARAQALADRAYLDGDADAGRRFRAEHPGFATDEIVARDLSTFRVAQRELVERLLASKRLRLAHAEAGLLFVHAGVTTLELGALGLGAAAGPTAIADRLNAALDDAVARRNERGGPLVIPRLHVPGDGAREGSGTLYHRPSLGLDDKERRELSRPPPRRRYPLEALPRGLVQVVGHIRDKKCRELLAPIADAHAPADGPLRTLIVDDDGARYLRGVQRGPPAGATMLFLDNGMAHVQRHPETYELLDVEARATARHG